MQQPDSDVLLDKCNVFVKYLPPDLTEEKFRALFNDFGTIVSSKIMIDQSTGKSLGYGFVRFETPQDAQVAIERMDGTKISNKRLLCKLANQSSSTHNYNVNNLLSNQTPSDNLYIKPLLPETSEGDLRDLFGKFGEIVDCKVMIDKNTGASRQIGFVRFQSIDEARIAMEEMTNYKLSPNAQPLTVKYADTERQKLARRALRNKNDNQDYGNHKSFYPGSGVPNMMMYYPASPPVFSASPPIYSYPPMYEMYYSPPFYPPPFPASPPLSFEYSSPMGGIGDMSPSFYGPGTAAPDLYEDEVQEEREQDENESSSQTKSQPIRIKRQKR